MAKLPPLRRTVQKPVTRRKIDKLSSIVESSRRATNTQKSAQRAKKPVKDRDYTFHVVLLADVLCQMCDSLQGEWRANCREQRCARADNSWDENRFLCRNNLQIALKCKSIVCVCIVSKSFGDHLRAVVLTWSRRGTREHGWVSYDTFCKPWTWQWKNCPFGGAAWKIKHKFNR